MRNINCGETRSQLRRDKFAFLGRFWSACAVTMAIALSLPANACGGELGKRRLHSNALFSRRPATLRPPAPRAHPCPRYAATCSRYADTPPLYCGNISS